MGGRMLAINEGAGYRPILTVKEVVFIPQQDARPPSTVIYGNQLMFLIHRPELYQEFFREKINTTMIWTQLRVDETESPDQVYAIWPKMPVVVVLEERLLLIAVGSDPLRGEYCQFAGGPIHLFSQADWWNETPEYSC